MSTTNPNQSSAPQGNQQEKDQQRQNQSAQTQRRHVSASPDDIDEDMEQGTQSGGGTPRNADMAAPDARKKNEDSEETNI